MYVASDGIEEFAGKPRVLEFEAIMREELEALFEGRIPNTQGAVRSRRNPAETVTTIQKRWEAVLGR
jgi:hypothetical protein